MRLFLLTVLFGVAWAANPIADSPAGVFRGQFQNSVNGRRFAAFLGIRFARPPTGLLRFKEPILADPVDGIYDATKEGDACLQRDLAFHQYPDIAGREYVGNEDCLFLNVYTPKIYPSKLLPVLFVIHGGGYYYGSGSETLNGPEILMDEDLVVVSTNYRLGVFGFFNLAGAVPGNLGLKDQNAALQWVKANIESFGGDPKRVTLLGESAGSASVHQQMLSPLSRGLFIQAISQSGTGDTKWAIHHPEQAKINAKKFLDNINCPQEPTEALDCLQQKSAEELLRECNGMMKYSLDMVFRPIVEEESENAFMTQKSIREGTAGPWLTGVTSAEGFCVVQEFYLDGLHKFEESYKEMLPLMLQYENSPNRDAISEKIKKYYLGSKSFSEETVKEMTQLFGDSWFHYGLYKSSKKHNSSEFVYYYDYQGEKSFYDIPTTKKLGLGVNHGDDYFCIFTVKKFIPDIKFNAQDGKVCRAMLKMWTKFIETGYPSKTWPDIHQSMKFMEFSRNGDIKVENVPISESMKFWDDLLLLPHHKEEL